jgi:2-keto-4-pentenoate hydratase
MRTVPAPSAGVLSEVADRLSTARRTGRATAPVRHALPPGDIAAAYAVQQLNVARLVAAGHRRVGRKIGLTTDVVQRQLGVNEPDFGVLFEAMDYGGSGAVVRLGDLIAPRIEAELAFRLGAAIDEPEASREAVARSVDAVAAAAEIVDSAIADWDIDIVDTVADNASCGGFAIGRWQPFTPDLDLRSREMRLTRGGVELARGVGAASLGDPLAAVSWLARACARMGDPLKAGEIVLSGALGPMRPLEPGDHFIEIEGFDTLWLRAVSASSEGTTR